MRIKTFLSRPWAPLLAAFVLLSGAGSSYASDTKGAALDAVASPTKAFLPGLSQSELDAVLKGGGIVVDAKSDKNFRFLVNAPEARKLEEYATRADPELLIGSLFLVPMKKLSEEGLLALVNELSKIGTMSGITYYSETRKKITVLFDDVYRVYEPGSKTKLPNLSFTAMPYSMTMTIHIKDVNFGSTWYSLLMERRNEALLVSLTNEKPLGIALFNAFGKRELEMRFLLLPVKEGLLVNGICLGNPSKAVYAFVDVYSAVEKRVRAVQGWIAGRAAALSESQS